ncbi:MAG: iron-sulfur cluster assembly scaffold protein [Gammaproteobacteria bacterium]
MKLGSAHNVYGYPPPVWARFAAPRHAGRLTGPGVHSVEAGSPATSARLNLQLRWEQGRVADCRFLARGCPVTLAVGEWLCERLSGASAAELAAIGAPEIRQALEIPEDKAHCALMGEDVLRSLMIP